MDGDEQPEATTASALFGLVWNELVDVLGSSATATLLRRAAKHGAVQRPELMKLTIHKPLFEYEYVVPEEWTSERGRESLQVLIAELVPLLRELTGVVVIHRLQSVPELARAQLVRDEEGGVP